MGKPHRTHSKNSEITQSFALALQLTVEDESFEDYSLGPQELSSYLQHPSRVQTIACSKNGGNFDVPFGCKLQVEPGTFKRRETVTVYVLTANQRCKHEPVISTREETLLSEIFRVESSSRPRIPIRIRVTHNKLDNNLSKVLVFHKDFSSTAWAPMENAESLDSTIVEFETTGRNFVFVVIASPISEKFDVPVLGCLHIAKINRVLQIRFPKSTVSSDIQCTIDMIPLSLVSLPTVLVQDIRSVTDIFRFRTSVPGVDNLRRAVTIKLPLPPSLSADPQDADIAVYQMSASGSWSVIETPIKLTRNSASFDTKCLSQYCVAEVQPGRKQRACEALRLAHDRYNAIYGDFLPILRTDNKHWTLWIECIRSDDLTSTREKLSNISNLEILSRSLLPPSATFTRASRTPQPFKRVSEAAQLSPDKLLLVNGTRYEFDIEGDLEFKESDCGGCIDGLYSLTYHNCMVRNCRRLEIMPKSHVHQGSFKVKGEIKIFVTDTLNSRSLIRLYKFEMNPTAVQNYFYIELEPKRIEVSKEQKRALKTPDPVTPVIQKKVEKTERGKRQGPMKQSTAATIDSVERLSRSCRPVNIGVSKESKVLSGKSLKILAPYIPSSIGLALQLRLTESSVSGIVFDITASQLSPDEVTYRLLLMWKRKSSSLSSDAQVEMLVKGMEELNWNELGRIILDQHKLKEELSHECLSEAKVLPPKPSPLNSVTVSYSEKSKERSGNLFRNDSQGISDSRSHVQSTTADKPKNVAFQLSTLSCN